MASAAVIYILIVTLLWVGPGWRTEGDHRIGAFEDYNECVLEGSQLDWTAEYYRMEEDGPVGRLLRWDCAPEEVPLEEPEVKEAHHETKGRA